MGKILLYLIRELTKKLDDDSLCKKGHRMLHAFYVYDSGGARLTPSSTEALLWPTDEVPDTTTPHYFSIYTNDTRKSLSLKR